MNITKYQKLKEKTFYKRLGKVVNVVGLTIESLGPDASLNDLCRISIDEEGDKYVLAEVVGFRDNRTLLMPCDSTEGIGFGCIVENLGYPLSVSVGDEMLGQCLDGLGRPTDGSTIKTAISYPVEAMPPDPMDRIIIDTPLVAVTTWCLSRPGGLWCRLGTCHDPGSCHTLVPVTLNNRSQ